MAECIGGAEDRCDRRLIASGIFAHPNAASAAPVAFHSGGTLLGALGVAMLPVLFSYNGFQGASFITGETRDPERTIPRGLVIGVGATVVIYLRARYRGCNHAFDARLHEYAFARCSAHLPSNGARWVVFQSRWMD